MPSRKILTYPQIIQLAWPLMLANIAQPLLGLVDTALMGHTGSSQALAALAVGALIVNFVYWNFGFLRMSTTALVARAIGKNDMNEAWVTSLRACILALFFGLIITALHYPISQLALTLIAPPSNVEESSTRYLDIRLMGAPLTLLNFVISGYLIATGETKKLLALQILLNVSNALLNIILTKMFALGITGIALGTVIAEALSVTAAAYMINQKHRNTLNKQSSPSQLSRKNLTLKLLDSHKVKEQLSSNRDIWLRTFFLLMSFMAFTHWSGKFGSNTLAANHILLQFIAFSAFFLDSYAHVTEAQVGQAIGADSKRDFNVILKKGTVLALSNSVVLGLGFVLLGPFAIAALTDIPEVVALCHELLIFAGVYIVLSFAAFQCDGIFIGANAGPALRNSSIGSTVVFAATWLLLLQDFGVYGLWSAFIMYVVVRALFLLAHLPKLYSQSFKN